MQLHLLIRSKPSITVFANQRGVVKVRLHVSRQRAGGAERRAADLARKLSPAKVDLHVCVQAAGLREGGLAHFAGVGPLPGVSAHVLAETAGLDEGRLALGALVRLLSCVCPHVSSVGAGMGEAGFALGASVRLVISQRVAVDVHLQVAGRRERGPALSTHVRLHSRVRPHMCRQMIRTCEAGIACAANVGPVSCVLSQVGFQVAVPLERRIARQADERSLTCVGAHVLSQ